MDDIKEIVHNVLEKISCRNQDEQQKIQPLWEKFSGKGAAHTKISGLKNQTLYVEVDSSAWLFQMNLDKAKIYQRLREQFPEIQKIHFKIGKVP